MVEQFIGYFSRWLAKLKDKLEDGNIKADWDIMLVAIFMESAQYPFPGTEGLHGLARKDSTLVVLSYKSSSISCHTIHTGIMV